MKKMGKRWLILCFILSILCVGENYKAQYMQAKKSQKHIIIAKIENNVLYYHKSVSAHDIFKDPDWENIIGYGPQKKIQLASDCRYYLIKDDTVYPNKMKRVTKKKFKTSLYQYERYNEEGIIYYWGLACKMEIKNGKCIKLEQQFQS